MANSADPNQFASPGDLAVHCLQMQDISGFSRTWVKKFKVVVFLLTGLLGHFGNNVFGQV